MVPHNKLMPNDKPESSSCGQKDKIQLEKLSSFAIDFYSNSYDDGGAACDDGGAAAKRAKLRMQYLTDSQWAVLGDQGQAAGEGDMVDKVLAWRQKRGDFDYHEEDDDDERGALLDDEEMPQLPHYMEDVTESTLQWGFLKSDLQLECLLRGLPYEASDSKPQLISKLMHYKNTLFLNANTFQLLNKDQCITSPPRNDEGGSLNDAVDSKSDALNSEYLTHSQGASSGDAGIGEGKGEGGAMHFMVDAWRKNIGGFHCDDEDQEEEVYVEDEDEEDNDDEQESFISDDDDEKQERLPSASS